MTSFTTSSSLGPNQTTALSLGDLDLDPNKTYSVSIKLNGNGSSFKFATTDGLQPAYGFSFNNALRDISFQGRGVAVQNAIEKILYTSGDVVDDRFETIVAD